MLIAINAWLHEKDREVNHLMKTVRAHTLYTQYILASTWLGDHQGRSSAIRFNASRLLMGSTFGALPAEQQQ